MNRISFVAALSCAALLVGGVGCKPASTVPEVSVTVGEVTSSSVSFSVSAVNAAECFYEVLEGSGAEPDAMEVIENGVPVDLTVSSDVTVEGLEASTEYLIVVAVRSGDGQTALGSVEATTGAEPAVVLDSASGRHHGSTNNWNLTLRGTVDAVEYEISLDLYDDDSIDAGYLTAGEYTVSDGTEDGDLNIDYSSVDLYVTEDDAWTNYHYTLVSGTLDVDIVDGEYSFRLDAVVSDGNTESSLAVVYDGPVDGIEIAG